MQRLKGFLRHAHSILYTSTYLLVHSYISSVGYVRTQVQFFRFAMLNEFDFFLLFPTFISVLFLKRLKSMYKSDNITYNDIPRYILMRIEPYIRTCWKSSSDFFKGLVRSEIPLGWFPQIGRNPFLASYLCLEYIYYRRHFCIRPALYALIEYFNFQFQQKVHLNLDLVNVPVRPLLFTKSRGCI